MARPKGYIPLRISPSYQARERAREAARPLRDALASDVDDYLSRGGIITKCPPPHNSRVIAREWQLDYNETEDTRND